MEYELMPRIVLEKPPAGVDFGLQKGRGSEYEVIQRQKSTTTDLQFDFTVHARVGRKGGAPDFLGALVQGPPAERFVYVDIGTYAGQRGSPWNRRLKVPLSGITWSLIRKASADSGAVLEVRVEAAGRGDGPNCGTAETLNGWTLVRSGSR